MSESDEKKKSTPSQEELQSEISRTLAKRRESRRLSLTEVSQQLKIRVPIIRAIESGEWNQLPGGVYLKGFLKRYTTFLGLNSDQLIEPYFNVSDEVEEEEVVEEGGTEASDRNARLWWVAIGLGVVLLMGLIKFLAVDYEQSVAKEAEASPVEKSDALAIGMEKTMTPAPVLEEHTLEVFSALPLWMRIVAEDRTFEGFVPQATTWTWKGSGQFTIRLGHTNEISLSMDGKKVTLAENQKRVYLPDEG